MKIATFNIQNLFHRDISLLDSSPSHCVLKWTEELDFLMQKLKKVNGDLDRIRELSFLLGFETVDRSRYAIFRKRNGRLYFQEKSHSLDMRASELTNWNGWVALQTIPINENAIKNKLKVIADTNADIILLQEVEDRASLTEFNTKMALDFDFIPYEQIMVIEGNNSKGLGMGIMAKPGYSLEGIKNHVHDLHTDGMPLFDIDCPQYTVVTPSGKEITIIDTYLSKTDDKKRELQCRRLANIYYKLVSEGKPNVFISGVFHDVNFSSSIAPLLRETDLIDVSKHETFNADTDFGKSSEYFRLGAFKQGVNLQQKEYLLLSPAMYAKLWQSGVNRKGVWRDKKPNWPIYKSLERKQYAASEYPLVWGEINV